MKGFVTTLGMAMFVIAIALMFVPISPSEALAAPCVHCSDVGCNGGTVLCAQFECKGTVVQCFGYGSGGVLPPIA